MKPILVWVVVVAALLSGCKGSAPLPAKAIDLNTQGADALATGDLETAEARFDLALEYSPRFVEALVNRALVEVQRGNYLRARRLLSRARRLNPDFAQPHHGYGVLEEREGRPDKASGHYLEALSIDPGYVASRLNLARLYYTAGKYEHAKEQFKRAVEVAPDRAEAYAGLAESLIKLSRTAEADEIVEHAFREFADDAQLAILQARAHLRRNKVDAAVELLQPLTRGRNDVAVAALGWLGAAELARGRPVAAERAAVRALNMAPRDEVASYVLKRAQAVN